ncbi:CrcB family protein [Citricoccus sp. SGAir0253]|uniref:fluoride efflux transporter FluC n=1 Tax=Citricoccus sp. SGAir0253 TaxID=2567881 RepID=UPI0010CCB960|nr:CrcB family protein [Citricoccus sp. SGAir0253]QCU77972.1 CrcB family protein [Citricoccus sp. SGAir0253]
MILVLIAAFGGAGAATRFVVDGLIRTRYATTFPAATVFINITGSLALGLLTAAAIAGALGQPWVVAASIGFCGGYTTFSTAMVETVRLVQAGDHTRAVLNVLGTGVATVAAAAAGLGLGHLIW